MNRIRYVACLALFCLLMVLAACGEACKREHCSNEFGFDYATGQYKMVYVCVCLDDVEVSP